MDIWIFGYIVAAWLAGWCFSYNLYKIESISYGAEIGKFDFYWFIALWIPFLICWALNNIASLIAPHITKVLNITKDLK